MAAPAKPATMAAKPLPGLADLPAAFTLHAFDSVASTNAEAARLARGGASDLTLVWAREQTAGRGRFDRRWASGRGNLFCSTVLRLADPRGAETLSLVAALATADAIVSLLRPTAGPSPENADRRVRVKWVNDVLLDDAKVSGCLCEAALDEGWIVVGIGINVGHAPGLRNESPGGTADRPVAYRATCLREAGITADIETALAALARSVERRIGQWRAGGFAGVLHADYAARLWRMDETIRVGLDAEGRAAVSGINRGVSEGGHLRIELADGTIRTIHAGDVL